MKRTPDTMAITSHLENSGWASDGSSCRTVDTMSLLDCMRLFYAPATEAQPFTFDIAHQRLEIRHLPVGPQGKFPETAHFAGQPLLSGYRSHRAAVVTAPRIPRIAQLLQALRHHCHLIVKFASTVGELLCLSVAARQHPEI